MKQFINQRKALQSKLFLAKKSFCKPLLELKQSFTDLQGIPLTDLSVKTFEPQQFKEYQKLSRNDAFKMFEATMETASSVLQKACTDITQITQSASNTALINQNAAVTSATSAANTSANKFKSMTALKEEQAEKKRQLQRAEQEIAMLPDFIRLVDYMEVEALVSLVINTSGDFLLDLLKHRKNGLFETIVCFVDKGTTFIPTSNQLQEIISETFDAMISMANSVNRILYLKLFHEKVANIVTDGPSVGELIRSSKRFKLFSRLPVIPVEFWLLFLAVLV